MFMFMSISLNHLFIFNVCDSGTCLLLKICIEWGRRCVSVERSSKTRLIAWTRQRTTESCYIFFLTAQLTMAIQARHFCLSQLMSLLMLKLQQSYFHTRQAEMLNVVWALFRVQKWEGNHRLIIEEAWILEHKYSCVSLWEKTASTIQVVVVTQQREKKSERNSKHRVKRSGEPVL